MAVQERQTAPKLNGIETYHKERYMIASEYVKDKIVLDAACGCGYGTSMLVDAGAKMVVGADASELAVAYAKVNWQGERRMFLVHDLNTGWKIRAHNVLKYDVVVSLETLEHLKSRITTNFRCISRILRPGGILYFSHPTHEKKGSNKFHNWFDIDPDKVIKNAEADGFEILRSSQQITNNKRYTYHLVAARKVV